MKYLIPLLLISTAAYAQYQPSVYAPHNNCTPTTPIAIVNYPGAANIPRGNNLVRPAGKSLDAEGQKLMLVGRVLDNRCMPIKDAIIEIWQTDPFGKWFLATRADLATPNPVFAGAGRTYTGNTGDFLFTTLFPAGIAKRAPFINVKVKVRGMKEFNTQLFFANDGRNSGDVVYNKLKPDAARSVTMSMQPLSTGEGYAGMIDIILPEKAKYVSY